MRFTIAKSNNPISKKFSLNNDGELEKEDGGNLTLATFDTQTGLSMSDLHDYILSDRCTDRCILIPGIANYDSGLIVTKGDIKRRENEDDLRHTVARTKDYFHYKGDEGFILLDYDPSDDYIQNDGLPLSKNELLNILLETFPELIDASMLWKTSSSSNISNELDGKEYRGVTGQHIFVAVKNTADIPRIIDILYARLWLRGHGYIFVDKIGRMHDRTIIDKVVNSPEREIFIKAECISPVVQDLDVELLCDGHNPLNTELITDLTLDESMRVEAMIAKAKAERQVLADSVMESYVKKMHTELGMSKIKLKECIQNHVLFGDTHIKLSTGVEVTVHDLFNEPEKYDGEYCYDPLEPSYGGVSGGSTKAWIDIDNKRIHGHAHGGIWYDLEFSDRKSPRELALEVCEGSDHNIMFKKAAVGALKMRYMQTELDQLEDYISKFARLKKGSTHKAFKAKYVELSGNDSSKTGGVSIELNSPALNQDGSIVSGMGQTNLSISIAHGFPHTILRGETRQNLDTFENFEFMCKVYNIKFSYDVIFKAPEITFPNSEIAGGDNRINASMSRIKSLCVLNGLGKDSVSYLIELINANQKNPVLDWVKRVKWDGRSRLQLVNDNIDVATYGESDDEAENRAFTDQYKVDVLRMWFIQCIAALDGAENSPLTHATGIAVPKYEHILVFVGGQGVQKTKFIKSMLPNELNDYILTGHELDVKDKDNVKIAISHWITELGELDSTFRKSDISSLKAFMSREDDQMRMPYAQSESKFKRRTSYCGTVNDVRFLVDTTGNRRYLPLEVRGLNPFSSISVPWKDVDGNVVGDGDGENDGIGIGSGIGTGIGSGLNGESDKNKTVDKHGKSVVVIDFGEAVKKGSESEIKGSESGFDDVDTSAWKNIEKVKNQVKNQVKSQVKSQGLEGESGVAPHDSMNPMYPIDGGENVGEVGSTALSGLSGGKSDKKVRLASLASGAECQQFWAEILHYYMKGEQWWPDDKLQGDLEYASGTHNRVDPTIDKLTAKFDLDKNDDWRKELHIRGEIGINSIGESVRFVTLNYTRIAEELGINSQDAKAVNVISNYLRMKGIHKKKYTVDGARIKAVRVALVKGERLNCEVGVQL